LTRVGLDTSLPSRFGSALSSLPAPNRTTRQPESGLPGQHEYGALADGCHLGSGGPLAVMLATAVIHLVIGLAIGSLVANAAAGAMVRQRYPTR
jgi:hypothetical protein